MGEPGKALRGRTRTYAQTMSQYNRILSRFSEMDENGEYDENSRRREERAEAIMNRYADNIANSEAYLRTLQNELNRGVKEGRDNRSSRDAAWNAADNVAIPYSVYARNRRRKR